MSLLDSLFARSKKKTAEPQSADEKPEAAEPEESLKLEVETPTPPPAVGRPPAGEQATQPAAPPISDLEEIRRQLSEIERIIGAEEAAQPAGEEAAEASRPAAPVVELRAATVLAALPPELLTDKAAQVPDDHKVTLGIPNLYDQLATGKVVVALREVALALPEGVLNESWEKDKLHPVSLPLPEVVAAIPPEELQKRMTLEEHELARSPIPDLFRPAGVSEPEKPAEPAVEAVTAAEAEAEAAPVEEKPAEAAAAVEPEEAVSEAAPAAEAQPVAQPEVLEPAAEAAGEEEEEKLQLAVEPETAAAKISAPPEAPAEEIPVEAEEAAPAPEAAPEAPEFVAVPPEPTAAEPEPVGVTEEESMPLSAEAAPLTAPPELAAVPVRPPEEKWEHPYLFVRGIDINRATAEEIAGRIDGIGIELARRIVADREENGPFFDVLDLSRVRGVGRRILEGITGRPLPGAVYRYAPQIRELLGEGRVPDVKQVADRLAALPGVEACVIAHREGYRVVATAPSELSDRLAAFAPQMYKKLAWYARQLDMGGLQSITLLIESQPVTITRGGEVFLILLHRPGTIKQKHIFLLHGLALELSHRLESGSALKN